MIDDIRLHFWYFARATMCGVLCVCVCVHQMIQSILEKLTARKKKTPTHTDTPQPKCKNRIEKWQKFLISQQHSNGE